MKRRVVYVQSRSAAIIFVIMGDERDQEGMPSQWKTQAKTPKNDLIPDKISLLIRVPRQVTIPAISETAVMIFYDEAAVMCMDTQRNLNRRESAPVATKTDELEPRKPFHVRVSNLAKKDTDLPKGRIVAQRSHSVA